MWWESCRCVSVLESWRTGASPYETRAPGPYWNPSKCAKSPRGPVMVTKGHIPERKSKRRRSDAMRRDESEWEAPRNAEVHDSRYVTTNETCDFFWISLPLFKKCKTWNEPASEFYCFAPFVPTNCAGWIGVGGRVHVCGWVASRRPVSTPTH